MTNYVYCWFFLKVLVEQFILKETLNNKAKPYKVWLNQQERETHKEELDKLRMERILRRQYLRHKESQCFEKSMQMLCGNAKDDEPTPFEDYSIFVYRQTAPDFKDRINQIEMKILYPVRCVSSLTIISWPVTPVCCVLTDGMAWNRLQFTICMK